MMKWTKPSPETLSYFERIAPGPPIESRRMFGMPSRFLNGHMLVSVFGNVFMLHLSASDREECIAAGARPFAPMGRSAKEYVEIVPGHFPDQILKEWIARGMRYLGSLPPKPPMKRAKVEAKVPPSTKSGAAPKTPKASPAPRARAKAKARVAPKAKGKAAAPKVAKPNGKARVKVSPKSSRGRA